MRVVILNQYYAPDTAATAQMASDLAAALVNSGHEVVAICSDRSYALPRVRYRQHEAITGVNIRRVRSTAFGRGSKLGRLIDYLTFSVGAARQLVFGGATDVVIALTTPPMIGLLAVLCRRVRQFRVVLWSMDVYPDLAFALGAVRRDSLGGRAFVWASQLLLRSSDIVVALGDCMASKLRSGGATHIEVVHNWADEDAITPKPAHSRASRVDWGWHERLVLLYSGNLGLAHEFDTVLAAARFLADRMPNVLFAFIGVGPRLKEVQMAARDLPNVEFKPFVERSRLGDTLAAADIHLVTLRPQMEGLVVPSKIYGILAAGRPTIYVGPTEGEVPDILRSGRCGTIVANDDVVSFTRAVRDYACDMLRRDQEGQRARAIFEQQFTRRRSIERFRVILEKLPLDRVRAGGEVSAEAHARREYPPPNRE